MQLRMQTSALVIHDFFFNAESPDRRLKLESVLRGLGSVSVELEAGLGGVGGDGLVVEALATREILVDDLVSQLVYIFVLVVLQRLDLVQTVAFLDHVADHLHIIASHL